ncbi:MAG: hypothetical protein ACD_3C00105G0014 [uncultured bacterium (gcode 4)]|uniref:Uncharacterized protein n=1 Tax=uncultured bacterium (gcode 4) TaxID=1234023 RepID=K2FAB1_9BACT|nr:MAG: hypothetical protein ACD_3C00105G0014 [uncultured bacterium (gcode 4)]
MKKVIIFFLIHILIISNANAQNYLDLITEFWEPSKSITTNDYFNVRTSKNYVFFDFNKSVNVVSWEEIIMTLTIASWWWPNSIKDIAKNYEWEVELWINEWEFKFVNKWWDANSLDNLLIWWNSTNPPKYEWEWNKNDISSDVEWYLPTIAFSKTDGWKKTIKLKFLKKWKYQISAYPKVNWYEVTKTSINIEDKTSLADITWLWKDCQIENQVNLAHYDWSLSEKFTKKYSDYSSISMFPYYLKDLNKFSSILKKNWKDIYISNWKEYSTSYTNYYSNPTTKDWKIFYFIQQSSDKKKFLVKWSFEENKFSEEKKYDNIYSLTLSKDWKSYAYIATSKWKEILIKDWKEYTNYIKYFRINYSSDWKSFIFIWSKDWKKFSIVKDFIEHKTPYSSFLYATVSKEWKVAYVTEKNKQYAVFMNSKEIWSYQLVYSLEYSENWKDLYYTAFDKKTSNILAYKNWKEIDSWLNIWQDFAVNWNNYYGVWNKNKEIYFTSNWKTINTKIKSDWFSLNWFAYSRNTNEFALNNVTANYDAMSWRHVVWSSSSILKNWVKSIDFSYIYDMYFDSENNFRFLAIPFVKDTREVMLYDFKCWNSKAVTISPNPTAPEVKYKVLKQTQVISLSSSLKKISKEKRDNLLSKLKIIALKPKLTESKKNLYEDIIKAIENMK